MSDVTSFRFHEARTRSMISLTPLIDVVFILLLFFMLASNFNVESSLSLRTTDQHPAHSSGLAPASSLQLMPGELVNLDGLMLDKDSLLEALTQWHADDARHALSISVADGVSVQQLLDLIALVEDSGLNRITMETALP